MIWNIVAQATDLVGQNPWLATLAAFAASIVEAVAVLGVLLPGTPVLMAVAGAAAMAGLPMSPILIAAILGAVIGDGLSYWVGWRYGVRLRGVWPFATRPWVMARAEGFFRRYGTMSVALCRFVPVLRSTVPLVAGMAGMRRQRFILANVGSAFVWAPAHVLPAQFAGVSILRLQGGDWGSATIWAAVLAACAVGAIVLHRLLRNARASPEG